MVGFRLYINNTEVDLLNDFPLSLNAQINDIRNPESRTTTFSKTITIPASKSNVDLFTFIYDIHGVVDTSGTVNFQPDFNPNLKAECIAIADGVEVFNGIAQLVSIRIVDNNDIEFDIVLFGQLVNLFANIGDKYLTDLDFTDIDHDYTLANVVASWSNSSGYVYPMIDYGNSASLSNFNLNNMYPAIFVKDYIDRIFSDSGCTYDSAFLETDFFKSLIIPFNSSTFKISDAEILERKFRASRETTIQESLATATNQGLTVVFNDDSTAPNFDSSAQFNTGTGVFTVGTGLQGTFNFTANMLIGARYVPDTPAVDVVPTQALIANVSIIKVDALNVVTFLNTVQVRMRMDDGAFPVNTNTSTDGTYPDNSYITTLREDVTISSNPVTLVETDRVGVSIAYYYSPFTINGALNPSGLGTGVGGNWSSSQMFIDAGNNVYDGDYYLQVRIGSNIYNEVSDATYVEGLPINMTNAVPSNIKQRDFLSAIIKMFNLYLEQDKDIQYKFIIEPRDDYYYDTVSSSTMIDLSDLLDISQDLDIKPMGDLDAKKYIFKYKDDKDYFNTEYLTKWKETYSQRDVDVTNDFIQATKTTELLFSATPSVGSTSTDRVIPRIINFDTNGVVSPINSNIRILIYSGLKATNQAWTITDNSGLNSYVTYPYCGMLDDPYSPTVSLDFEVPDEIFWTNAYGTVTYTNKNLYNVYFKRFIEEITDRNSKIVTGMFDISPYTFSLIDFRKIYYFEREYFRLNRIIDYNPLKDGLTKMEFVKINRGINSAYTDTDMTDVGIEDLSPTFPRFSKLGNNIQPLNALVSGEGNRIADSTKSCLVNGEDNTIGEWCEHISITGDGNSVAGYSSGVVVIGDGNLITGTNIVLINTYDKIISVSNSTYIDGRAVSGLGSIILVSSNKTIATVGDDDATTYLCDATSGNITINLPACEDFPIGLSMNIKKIDSSVNTVTVDGDGTETIDGSLTQIISSQYDNIQIITDGANWHII